VTPSPLDRTEFAAARADHRLSESIEPSTGATRLVIIILIGPTFERATDPGRCVGVANGHSRERERYSWGGG
jgi:hypothetical protein